MDARQPSQPTLTDAQIALVLGEAGGSAGAVDARSAGVARLRTAIETMRDGAMQPVPERLVARLVRLEAQARFGAALDRVADVVTGGVMGAMRAIVATLTYDSRVSPALAGFRGTAGAVQLVFASEAGEVHLHVTESGAGDGVVTVRGVLEPAAGARASGPGGGSLVLTPEAGGAAVSGAMDEDQMFVLRVAPGAYRAMLGVGGAKVDLGVLELP